MMKDFGTFDTLTDEEDTLYNRLAVIRSELERLDLEQNDAQQEIKMWRNKMLDDKFKLKFWLVTALVVGVGALPWHQIVLEMVPSGVPLPFVYGYIFSVVATFLNLMQLFVFLPLFLIVTVVFLVRLTLNILRNSKKDQIIKLAENMGVQNRYMLIDEQKAIIGSTAKEIELLEDEKRDIKARLESIKREKA